MMKTNSNQATDRSFRESNLHLFKLVKLKLPFRKAVCLSLQGKTSYYLSTPQAQVKNRQQLCIECRKVYAGLPAFPFSLPCVCVWSGSLSQDWCKEKNCVYMYVCTYIYRLLVKVGLWSDLSLGSCHARWNLFQNWIQVCADLGESDFSVVLNALILCCWQYQPWFKSFLVGGCKFLFLSGVTGKTWIFERFHCL